MSLSSLWRGSIAGVVLIGGIAGVAAIWVSASVLGGNPCSPIGLLAAFVAWLLLHLAGVRAGAARALVAVLATAATMALSYWFVVATQFGLVLGLDPMTSAQRLGPVLAEALTRRFLAPADPWILAAAIIVAALAGYGRRR